MHGSSSFAQGSRCKAFGAKFFFETEGSEQILICFAEIENKSEFLLKTDFDSSGNLVPTNAVISGVETIVLAGLLEALTEEERATVFSRRNLKSQTILHLAVGSPNAVRLIRELGHYSIDANPCATFKNEWFWDDDRCDTPLHTAVTNDASFEILQSLLAIGANPDIPNRDGKFPANISTMNDQETAKLVLLQKSSSELHFDKDPYNGEDGNELNALFYLVKCSQDHHKLERIFQITDESDHNEKFAGISAI